MNTIVFVGEHPKTFDVRWHTHETWELIYCTSGQGSFRFQDGRIIPYHAGEMVVIPPQEVHANSSEEGFTNIHLNISEPSFPYRSAFKIQDESGSLHKAFVEARLYYTSDKAKRELVLASLGELITSYLVVFRSNSEFTESVEMIRNSILQNYTNPEYALDEYIRSLPFHYDYLRKIFKKELGMSPLEYMTSLRMKNAERLLSTMWTSGYAIAEIAQMCGFDNALYFSRVFKKYFGCSPSQFVKTQREIYSVDPGRKELKDEL
jgi:AraC-like DNA-binding protein